MKKLISLASVLFVLPLVASTACTTEKIVQGAPAPAAPGEEPGAEEETPGSETETTTEGEIGPEGGYVEGGDVQIGIPKGALAEATTITITKTTSKGPERHVGVTSVYAFEPKGLELSKTATITISNVPDDVVEPTIAYEQEPGIFVGLPTEKKDGKLIAKTKILGAGVFVAAHDCRDADGKPKATCKALPAPATLKSGRQINGFAMTGFEYWQWKKPDPYAGGKEVAWGYNGDGEPKTGVKPTDQSRACMAESFLVLEDILTNDVPPELEALAEQHGVRNFWFWNNDLTDAAPERKVSKAYEGLWLFDGDRGDGGLIKWMSHTQRDGTCNLPTREDLVIFATACQTAFPKCGSGK